MNRNHQVAFWLLWIAAVALFGLLTENPFLLTLAGYASAFAIFALSVNVMLGGLNEVPLGQSLFFGIGAYGAAIAQKTLGLPFATGIALGALVAGLVALSIGALTLRLTGAYFSIVSWGMAGVAAVVALNSDTLTGGALGLFGFSSLSIAGLDMTEPRSYFFVCAGALIVLVYLLGIVRASRFGEAMESIRQNAHLAQAVGINVFRQRLKAFVLSGILAAISGALCVPFTQIVTPENLSVLVTVDALLMVLLGGTGLLVGPVIGAMIFVFVPHFIEMDANVRILVFSIAIVLIMMFAPGGMNQIAKAVLLRLRQIGATA